MRSAIIAEAINEGRLLMVGCVYNIGNGKVEVLPTAAAAAAGERAGRANVSAGH